MTEHSKTVRLRIGQWYAFNMLNLEPGYNAEIGKWNDEKNECTMTITCFDDYPYPLYRKTKDDLEEYVIRKFGSMILDDLRKPRNLELAQAAKGIPLRHPFVKADKKDYPSLADSYKEEYILSLTKKELEEANSTLLSSKRSTNRLKPDKVKPTSGYESDKYELRIGKW